MRELAGYREAVEQGRPEDVYEDLHKGPVFDPELRVVIVGSYGAARQVLDNKDKVFTNAKTLMPVYKPEPDVMAALGEGSRPCTGVTTTMFCLDHSPVIL